MCEPIGTVRLLGEMLIGQMPLQIFMVKDFALKLVELLSEYEYASEHIPSRVVLLAKKKWHKKTWIDYDRFFELVNAMPSNVNNKTNENSAYPDNLDAELYTVGTRNVKAGEKDEMKL